MPIALLLALFSTSTAAAAEPATTGEDIYAAKCATCHGATGQGDGPAAGALPRKPADMTLATFWSANTEVAIRTTITKGKPGSAMRGFPMKPELLDALVEHLKTFKPAE